MSNEKLVSRHLGFWITGQGTMSFPGIPLVSLSRAPRIQWTVVSEQWSELRTFKLLGNGKRDAGCGVS